MQAIGLQPKLTIQKSISHQIDMLIIEKIKQLREERQMPQRKLAVALEINTPMYRIKLSVAKSLQNGNNCSNSPTSVT